MTTLKTLRLIGCFLLFIGNLAQIQSQVQKNNHMDKIFELNSNCAYFEKY